jgi:LAS superfamily LD-carboxypeptidase LdcB
MKKLLTTLVLFVVFSIQSYSQTDILTIKLKNNSEENIELSKIQKITFENIVSVQTNEDQKQNLLVHGNIPNPFSEQTIIEFDIVNAGNVTVFIYNNIGYLLKRLECNDCREGKNSLIWNCIDD